MNGVTSINDESPGRKRFEDALALDGQGRTHEAVEAYREAVTLDPRLSQAHFNLGIALAQIGQTDQAIRSWQRAVWLKADFKGELIQALDLDHELREIEILPNLAPVLVHSRLEAA